MKEQFVTYDIALKLKELGFDGQCFAFYFDGEFRILHQFNNLDINSRSNSEHHKLNSTMNLYAAPLWQQAIDWLREKHDLIVYVSSYQKDKHLFGVFTYGDEELTELGEWIVSYKEAREQAILKTIELINERTL